jgi:hypothetical protein
MREGLTEERSKWVKPSMDWRRPVPGDDQERRLMPRMSRIRPQTVHRPANPVGSRGIFRGDPADDPFSGSQMGRG